MTRNALNVHVNECLTLDAGTWTEVRRDNATRRLVYPPAVTMFDQVLGYLEAMPDSGRAVISITNLARSAVAACLRWGTYLAVLLDSDKPMMGTARLKPRWGDGQVSRISDSEMKRINIEVSYALARWIDIMRTGNEGRYYRLVSVAAQLPFPIQSARPSTELSYLHALAEPATAAEILAERQGTGRGTEKLAQVQDAPSRVLANAIISAAWRNGSSVEDIHAGRAWAYPLNQRRVTDQETHRLMSRTTANMITGMETITALIAENSSRTWEERVAVYGLAGGRVTPSGWSVGENSANIELPQEAFGPSGLIA